MTHLLRLSFYRERVEKQKKYLEVSELAASPLEWWVSASSVCVLKAEADFSSSLPVYNVLIKVQREKENKKKYINVFNTLGDAYAPVSSHINWISVALWSQTFYALKTHIHC